MHEDNGVGAAIGGAAIGALGTAAAEALKKAKAKKILNDPNASDEEKKKAKDVVESRSSGKIVTGATVGAAALGGSQALKRAIKDHHYKQMHNRTKQNETAAVCAIRVLRETLTEEAYNAIMDDAVSLTETGVVDSNTDAIKFAASRIVDEETCRVVNAIIDEAILSEGPFNNPTGSKPEAIDANANVSNESTSIMGSIWGDSMDESTKAGTIGTNALKGAAKHAAIGGAVGAVAGATVDPNVRAARKELRKAKADDDNDRVTAAKEKLKAARIAGAKRGAIIGAKQGAVGGAVSGAFDGAEKYKETHTGSNGEPIIDVKNYAEKKSKKTKPVDGVKSV